MRKQTKNLVRGAIIAALYVVLTHMQNLLLPGSATWAVQLRLSEALCVLCFFTPAAAHGLAVGCLLFNLTFAAALPADFIVGTLASWLSGLTMYRLRNRKLRGVPVLGLLMPAIWNAVLVGGELAFFIGGGFWFNAAAVFLGEAIVLLTFGWVLYLVICRRRPGLWLA